jgi:transketolase
VITAPVVLAPPLPDGKSLREVFGIVTSDLADTRPDILMLDADLGSSTRADIFEKRHPDRFLPMGIAEQNMMGVAAGLATVGYVPFISTFVVFAVKRSLDQVRVLIAQPQLNVKITAGYGGLLTGMTGKTHQAVEDVAVMRAMPHMTVVAPADEIETAQALAAITEYDGPVYMRLTRDPSPRLFNDAYHFALGSAVLIRPGHDVVLLSYGPQSARTLEAAVLLEADGIDAGVVHVPTLKPLDEDALVQAAEMAPLLVTVEEHSIIGGLSGAVAETLSERHPTWVRRIGLADVYGESGPNDALLEKYGLSARRVALRVRELVREQQRR